MTLAEYTKKATHEEMQLLAAQFNTWLDVYVDEVRKFALEQIDDILSDPTSLYLLAELHERTEKEKKEGQDDFYWFLQYGHEYRPRNHVLTHSSSYRDVLYDKYLKDRIREDVETD